MIKEEGENQSRGQTTVSDRLTFKSEGISDGAPCVSVTNMHGTSVWPPHTVAGIQAHC